MAKSTFLPTGLASASRRIASRRRQFALWRWINLAISFLVLVFLASPSGHEAEIRYTPGAALAEPFVAPFDLETVDEQARQAASERVAGTQYFRIDAEKRRRSEESLKRILDLAAQSAAEQSREPPPKARSALAKLTEALRGLGFADPAAATTLARRAAYGKFAPDVQYLLQRVYDERGVITPDDKMKYRAAAAEKRLRWAPSGPAPAAAPAYDPELLLDYPAEVDGYLRRALLPQLFGGDPEASAVVETLLASVIEPIVALDTEEKGRQIEAVKADGERRFIRRYHKGEVVFPAGQTIGPEEEEVLKAFRSRLRRYQAFSVLGVSVFVAILFSLVVFYARQFPGEAPFTASGVALVSLPVIIAFALWRILGRFVATEQLAGFGFPSGLIGMLCVTLVSPRLAWLSVTCGALLFGVACHFNFEYPVVALFGGFAAITSLYSTQTRRDILASGAVAGVVNMLVIMALLFIKDPTALGLNTGWPLLFGVANGLVCASLALPLLWVFERSFGVVTDFTLLELTGIHHPLLRELEQKAPGTYQHTLNVTKLAEAAAQAIGANYLLVRAGGLFHDVGKMAKPRYFSENQVTQEDRNLHSKLSPYMSTLIIKNHVKEGLEMARRYKTPPVVAAFIPEHQGTSLISYFYNEALQQFEESESTDPVREEDFRYPGPKPQSIETAIVMLADTVEATVTSVFTSANVNEDELRRVVRRTIGEKFDDDQFDECDLTLRDLHVISETFVKTLLGRFHHRVAYPIGPRNGGPVAPGALSIRRVQAPGAKPPAAAAND